MIFCQPSILRNLTVPLATGLKSNMRVQRLVVEHESRLLEAWNEYHGGMHGRSAPRRASSARLSG